MKKKLLVAGVAGFAFALMVAACLIMLKGSGSSAAAGPGVKTIEVSAREKLLDGREDVSRIGRIVVQSDGSLGLAITKEGKAADSLRAALEALKSKTSLSLTVAEEKEVDGKKVKAAALVEVPPADARFLWAVVAFLNKEYGFECEVN